MHLVKLEMHFQFLYNWTRITELRSIHKRLMEFEAAIDYDKIKLRKPRKSDVRA